MKEGNCFKFKYMSFIFHDELDFVNFHPVHMQTFLVYICSLDFPTFCDETRNQYCVDNARQLPLVCQNCGFTSYVRSSNSMSMASCRGDLPCANVVPWSYRPKVSKQRRRRQSTGFLHSKPKTQQRSFYPLGTSAMAHVSDRVRYRDTTVQLGTRTNWTERGHGRVCVCVYHDIGTRVTATRPIKETGESRALTLHRRMNGGRADRRLSCQCTLRYVYPVGGRRTVATRTIRHGRCIPN